MKKLIYSCLLAIGLITRFAGATQAQSALPFKLTGDGITVDRLAYCNGKLYFCADEPSSGKEPWISDGTVAGTSRLGDLAYGAEGSSPAFFTPMNSLVFFIADDGPHGSELWVTDGTTAATRLVKDIRPGTATSYPNQLTVSNRILYFSADDGVAGRELWRSDGTTAGTYRVKDMAVGASSSDPDYLTDLDGVLYFSAQTPATGREIFRSNGTAAGTLIVSDIASGTASSYPGSGLNPVTRQFTKVGYELFFVANNGTTGTELWKTDGTAAGTLMVKDIRPGSATSELGAFRELGGILYLWANDGVNGGELWKSDGTNKGTRLVKDINPGPNSSHPQRLMSAGGQLFFDAVDGIHGREVWKSDGTSTGTVLVKDINPGSGNIIDVSTILPYSTQHIENAVGSGIALYFAATDGTTSGYPLWRSDGTLAGTRRAFSSSFDAMKVYHITHGNYTYFSSGGLYRIYYPLTRMAAPESDWNVSVLGNPVKGGQLTVEVSGAGGEPLSLSLMDEQGRTITHRQIEKPEPVEKQSFPIGTQPASVLFLNVSTPTKSKIVKVLKD